MALNCYKCSEDLLLEVLKDISRQEDCPKCAASLRCCKMCRFYDTSAYNECSEPMADRITEKEKPNFCGYFSLTNNSTKSEPKDDLLAKANSLFK